MPKICYIKKRFNADAEDVIRHANKIIAEFKGQGIDLTLRMIYYKFVARDLFPEDRKWKWVEKSRRWVKDDNGTKNAQPNYKWMSAIIDDARYAGLIDWSLIDDITREIIAASTWDSPAELVGACASQFSLDMWGNQKYRPEVWVEKDAVVGVFEPTCRRLRVPLFSCRGFASSTSVWAAAMRLKSYSQDGQEPVVFHYGDHDPSGIDMTRDIRDRLSLFARQEIRVERLALTMDQIEEFQPPPNPAKMTDSRAEKYVEEYGDESWELDALEPTTIIGLIEKSIAGVRNQKLWKAREQEEKENRTQLQSVADQWETVIENL